MSLQALFEGLPFIEGSTIATIIGSNGLIYALSSSNLLKTETKHQLQSTSSFLFKLGGAVLVLFVALVFLYLAALGAAGGRL